MSKIHPSYRMAVDAAGSQGALAAVLGVKPQSVSWRCNNGKPLAAEDALIVEREFGVSRQALRPDIFGRFQSKEGTAA